MYVYQRGKVIDICLWLALGIEDSILSSYFVVPFETPEINETVDHHTKVGDDHTHTAYNQLTVLATSLESVEAVDVMIKNTNRFKSGNSTYNKNKGNVY